MNDERIVDYLNYCRTCEYKNVEETEEPCNTCLTFPVNVDSKKPIKWKEKK